MASRVEVVGDSSTPFYFGRASYGADDLPQKKRWNHYSISVAARSISPSRDGYWCVPSTDIIPWTIDDTARLVDKTISKIRGHNFDAGVFVGTSHEVAKAVVGSTSAIITGVRSLKRGDLTGALRSLSRSVGGSSVDAARKRLNRKDVSGAWLALQYGWLPLYEDVYAASTAFEALSAPLSMTVPKATRVIRTNRSRESCHNGYDVRSSRFSFNHVTLSALPTYAQQMGLNNPAEIAWELLPWSFVVDWFFPIGRYIRQAGYIPFLSGINYSGGGYSSIAVFNGQYDPTFDPERHYEGLSGSNFDRHYLRTAGVSASSMQVVSPRFVGFDKVLKNSKRILNAVALLNQVIRLR